MLLKAKLFNIECSFSCCICFLFTGINNCLILFANFSMSLLLIYPKQTFSYINLLSVCSYTLDSLSILSSWVRLLQSFLTCFSLDGFFLVLPHSVMLRSPCTGTLVVTLTSPPVKNSHFLDSVFCCFVLFSLYFLDKMWHILL